MDWKDALKNFAEANPDLPPGSDAVPEPEPVKKLPRIDIVLDRKGRKGKPATIAAGFDADDNTALQALASQLKQKLACGGSARGGEILIQGDRRQDLADALRAMGYTVRIC